MNNETDFFHESKFHADDTTQLRVSELVDLAYQNSLAHGFHDPSTPVNIGEKLALIHSEISEALEEVRSHYDVCDIRIAEGTGKPEGFPVELADAVIRIADLCGALGIDLNAAILQKHAYNVNRPHKHGKAF